MPLVGLDSALGNYVAIGQTKIYQPCVAQCYKLLVKRYHVIMEQPTCHCCMLY